MIYVHGLGHFLPENILDNAVSFSPRGSHITVKADGDERSIAYAVPFAPGLDAGDRERPDERVGPGIVQAA